MTGSSTVSFEAGLPPETWGCVFNDLLAFWEHQHRAVREATRRITLTTLYWLDAASTTGQHFYATDAARVRRCCNELGARPTLFLEELFSLFGV